MVDVVGLRFVTEGQKEALASLEMYRNGIRQMKHVQDRHVAEMNRALRQETQAFALNQRLKQRYMDEEARARQQAMRDFARVQRMKEQSLREEARAQAQAAQEAQRVAQINAEVARSFGQAVVAANTYTTANKSAADSAAVFAQQLDRVDAANAAVARAFGQAVVAAHTYTTANKSAADSAAVFARELAQQEQATARAARETQQFLQTLLRIDQPYKEASASADVFVQAQQRAAQSYARLQASINPTIAAQQRMRQVHETVRAALNAEIITREQAAQTLREYRAASTQMNAVVQQATRGQSRLGVVFQQAGYQIGDFAVQVQSGTHYMVALGQQLTQLVGVGAMLAQSTKWIAAFSALGIIVPITTAVAGGLMRMRENAEDAAGGVETLEDQLRSLDRTLQDYLRTREAAREGITVEELLGLEGLEEAEQSVARLRQEFEQIQRAGQASIITGGGGFAFFARRNAEEAEAALETLIAAENRLATLRRQQGEEQFRTFSERLTQYQEEIALQETIARFGDDSAQARAVRAEQALAAELRRIEALRQAEDITDAQAVALTRAAEEAARATAEAEAFAAVDMASGVNAAADAAARLADNLAFARSLSPEFQANAVRAGVASGAIPPQALGDLPQTDAERAYQNMLENRRRAARSATGQGGGASQAQEDYLLQLQQEADLRLSLIGLSEEEQRYLEISNELRERGLPIEEERIRQLIATEEELRRATEAEARRQNVMDTVTQSIETALMGLIDGSKSVEEAFTGMIRAILQEIAMQAIVKPIASAITSSIFANGGVFSGGNVVPFADGGVIGSPMTFPLSGGRTGLMGEAGPEAIMPLKRGKDGKLGVVAESGGNVTVQNHFHIAANGDESVKRIISQEAPKIAALTQRQIVDQRRRGGAMKSTFG